MTDYWAKYDNKYKDSFNLKEYRFDLNNLLLLKIFKKLLEPNNINITIYLLNI